MPATDPAQGHAGAFRLFQVAGISVYLHWSWLLVAYIELQWQANYYQSQAWNVAQYLTLFGIVLIHEFGHALACRQVGGQANKIVLWPLGGVAYVNPPPRPGAFLWSIAAGPLVNVVLLPLTIGAVLLGNYWGLDQSHPDAEKYLEAVLMINAGLLLFNMLPIYPLDGGQILQSLLWFVIGRARSLMVVSVIGMAAGVACVGLALKQGDVWFGVLAAYVAWRAWIGFRTARMLAHLDTLPRHPDARCPSCGAYPLAGAFWQCEHCQQRFDTFAARAVCPGCGAIFPATRCFDCGQAHPIAAWFAAPATPGHPPAAQATAPDRS